VVGIGEVGLAWCNKYPEASAVPPHPVNPKIMAANKIGKDSIFLKIFLL